jgi:predicted amidohydrolase YtcJ
LASRRISRRRFLKYAGATAALLGLSELPLVGAGCTSDQKETITKTIPGLCDHHSHTSLYIAFSDSVSFWNVSDKEEAQEIIAGLPRDELTLILGWDRNNFTFTDEELAGMPPVIIVQYSLHYLVMSKAAEAMVMESDPDIAALYKDQEWYEKHIGMVLSFLGSIPTITAEGVENHLREIGKSGVAHIQDMLLVSDEAFRIISESPQAGKVTFWASPELYEELPPDVQRKLKGIKVFTDGGITPETSAMLQPYPGGTDKGLLCYEDEAFLDLMRKVAGHNQAIAMHAVGDRAVHQILELLHTLESENLWFPEVRIEHAQFINVEQARDAKDLGVILSMQPNFSYDSMSLSQYLPEGYPEKNNPFRMLIDEAGFVPGEDLIFGSDGMPHGAETALEAALFPPEEGQELTLEELIKGYTLPGEKSELEIQIDYENKRVELLQCREGYRI